LGIENTERGKTESFFPSPFHLLSALDVSFLKILMMNKFCPRLRRAFSISKSKNLD
jgi:hypothetical protein